VAIPLGSLARVMGFRTVVVDARPRFATRERFPDADAIRIGIPSEIVAGMPLTPATALVLLAHDHKFELPVLRHALRSKVGYVGMLGSRRRGEAIRKLLRAEGVPEEALARLRVPIGLDLGGDSAAEIALAILAEVQAARAGASARPLAGVAAS
jgi:xanthine dehydrogenase accessory factor